MSSKLVQTLQLCHFVPMTDEPKDVRLPFMVTASEAKAIDEWRYKNKIPSRAEAMRMLINRGILLDDYVSYLHDATQILMKLAEEGKLSEKQMHQFALIINTENENRHKNNAFEYKSFEGFRDLIDKMDAGYAQYLKNRD